MVADISAPWKQDILTNFSHDRRVYFNPRNQEYPPLDSYNGFTYRYSEEKHGRFYAATGSNTYIYDLPATATIEAMVQQQTASTDVVEFVGDTAFKITVSGTQATATYGATTSTATPLNHGWNRIAVRINASDMLVYNNGALSTTTAIGTKSGYSSKLIVRTTGGLAWLRIMSEDVGAAEVASNYKTYKGEEAFWSFNGHSLGVARCNITRFVHHINIRRASGRVSECGLTMRNINGEFSDDQYGTYAPELGRYNGTAAQKYLRQKIPLFVESVAPFSAGLAPSLSLAPALTLAPSAGDAAICPLFVGIIPAAGSARNADANTAGVYSVTAYDNSYDFVRRIVWLGRQYENYTLAKASMVSGVYNPATPTESLVHTYARLATTGEIYNHALQTTFAGTLSASWTAVGGTISASATSPFYQTNILSMASATTSVYQVVTFPLTKGEVFSFSAMIMGTGNYTISLTEYSGSTAGSSTSEVLAADATSYRYMAVTHTVTSSSSDRLRITIAKGAGNAGSIDCPMLNYGAPVAYYVPNTAVGSSGVGSYNSRVAGYYDTCGIDSDAVLYVHPWAVIQPQAQVWNHIVALAEACAARFFGMDSSGCFVFRSGIGGTDPAVRAITGQASAVAVSMRPKLNQLSLTGAYIIKSSEVSTMWSLDATGADAANKITIANGAYFPTEGSLEAVYNTEKLDEPEVAPEVAGEKKKMQLVSRPRR